jgi:hypothetical protein
MATIEELLEHFSPEVGELTLETRELVRSVMPDAVEKVNLGWKNVIFSTGPTMRSAVFVINPMAKRVNLNIGEATTLDDPDRLLEGTGKGIRHVKIHDRSVLARPELRRLLETALKRARS